MSVFKRYILGLSLFFLSCVCAQAQSAQPYDSLMVYFRQGSSAFESEFMDNKLRCDQFIEHILVMHASTTFTIYRIDFVGHASPEGSIALNDKIAKKRAENVVKYLHTKLQFDDSSVLITSVSEDWPGLADLIVADDEMPNKDKVLDIVRNESLGVYREKELKEKYPQEWNYMLKKHFPSMRNFKILIYIDTVVPELEGLDNEEDIILPVEFSPLEVAKDSVAFMPMPWKGGLAVKTNGLAWGIGHQNVAVEFDLAPHWSVSVPFYYSGGFDYFKSTIKFRGIVLQPEARYYFKPDNAGFYAGMHMGVGWYNFAVGGDYRIQDHNGNRPAWGGGLGFGYAMQLKKAPSWGLEFALGAGVYDALYDKFYNEDNGPIAESAVRKLFIGIDNAAVSVTYSFGKRKEDRR